MATLGDTAGFDCEFVEKPPRVLQSECPVCLQVLREPYQAPCCGYSFCCVCINRIQADNKPCPTCNKENFSVFHNKGLQRSLYEFQVYCSHKSKGCDWKGELGQLDNHLSLSGDCPMAVIDCDFCHVGCDVRVIRREMPTHLNENLAKHVSLQAASYSKLLDRVQQLESELKQQVNVPTLGYIEFTMRNFENHKKYDYHLLGWWQSKPFYTHPGGYKFNLEVDANGSEDVPQVTMFVNLLRGEFDDHLKFPFRGHITVQLVDQEEGEKHITETFSYTDDTPDTAAGQVLEGDLSELIEGIPFISHDKLEPNYLKKDCLRFRVTKYNI